MELCGGPGSSACLFASSWACSLLLTVLEGTGEMSGRKGAHQFQLCCPDFQGMNRIVLKANLQALFMVISIV